MCVHAFVPTSACGRTRVCDFIHGDGLSWAHGDVTTETTAVSRCILLPEHLKTETHQKHVEKKGRAQSNCVPCFVSTGPPVIVTSGPRCSLDGTEACLWGDTPSTVGAAGQARTSSHTPVETRAQGGTLVQPLGLRAWVSYLRVQVLDARPTGRAGVPLPRRLLATRGVLAPPFLSLHVACDTHSCCGTPLAMSGGPSGSCLGPRVAAPSSKLTGRGWAQTLPWGPAGGSVASGYHAGHSSSPILESRWRIPDLDSGFT